jgi:hypothetical protein
VVELRPLLSLADQPEELGKSHCQVRRFRLLVLDAVHEEPNELERVEAFIPHSIDVFDALEEPFVDEGQ